MRKPTARVLQYAAVPRAQWLGEPSALVFSVYSWLASPEVFNYIRVVLWALSLPQRLSTCVGCGTILKCVLWVHSTGVHVCEHAIKAAKFCVTS